MSSPLEEVARAVARVLRKPVLLAALVGGAAALARRVKARRGERDVWKTATKEPDLR